MPDLLLASSSPYRCALLDRLCVRYRALSPEIDETPRELESGPQLAARLGREKAGKIAAQFPEAAVIGSDQVALLDQRILSKPGCRERAREQLGAASGRTVVFYTSVCLHFGGQSNCHVDETRVQFRLLSATEIDRYLDQEQPFDCAGSFKAEGLGIALFEHIESSDPTALQGLPLIWLAGALRQLGMRLP